MSDFKAKMHQLRFRLMGGKGEGMRGEGREEKGGEMRPFW